MGIPVKLPVFEGPLELLLHLIEKNKIDIYDIPIVEITNQYMEYIRQMEREDLKCRMLLPKEVNEEGEEEDPRQELVEQLLQYKMYKYISYELRDREVLGGQRFYRDAPLPKEVAQYSQPVDLDELIGDLTLTRLHEIFREVIRRQHDKIDPVRSRFGKIEKEEVTLPEKMEFLAEYTRTHRSFRFRDLLMRQTSKVQVIVTFLAVLEMMKAGKITVRQEDTFGEIMILSKDKEDKDGGDTETRGDH